MSDQFEARLRQAVCEAGDLLDASLPPADQCNHLFSPAFEQKMEKFLRRRKRLSVYRGLQRAACLFLACLLGGAVLLSTNAQAREALFGWVKERIENTFDYRFHGGISDAAYHYRLAEVPPEYQEMDRYVDETMGGELYENDAGEYLDFSYQYVTETSESILTLFFADEMEEKTVSIHGISADYYFDQTRTHSNALVWTDPETNALLTLSAYLDEDDLIHMAEQIIREEK